jgi:hypothetical protein
VAHARDLLKFAEDTAGQRQREHDEAVRKKDALNLPYWKAGWARPPEHAEEVLREQPAELQRLAARSLRSYAAEALNEALTAYQYAAGGVLPSELNEMVQRRRQLAEGFGGIAGDSVDFATVARPLRDLLDSRSDADQVLEERITRSQAEREAAIGAARQEAGNLEMDMRNTQEAIAGRIDSALRGIAVAFNELDLKRPGGYGADLRIELVPPTAATDPLRWKVTPVWRRSPSGGMVSYPRRKGMGGFTGRAKRPSPGGWPARRSGRTIVGCAAAMPSRMLTASWRQQTAEGLCCSASPVCLP